jgi:hypothetical protein
MWDESKCDRCGDCLVRCQYVDYNQEKAIQEITALIEGRNAEILKECITCVACNEYCTKGANPFDLICQLQERWGALSAAEAMAAGFDAIMNAPSVVTRGDPNKPVLSLCITETMLPEGAIEGQMFEGLSVVKGAEYFCYIGLIHMGKESPIRENAQNFVDKMASLGAKEVILLHDDCYAMLANKVADYGIKVEFKPVHIIEYMLDYLKGHPGSITKLGRKIAYQRPCASRYTPEKDVMLDELFEVIGVHRLARKHDREDALCCGSVFGLWEPNRAAQYREMNLADAKNHGAEAMVFLCPWCYDTLKKDCQERGMAPVFITDLCRMALGERPIP